VSLRKGRVIHLYDFSGGVNIRDPGYLIEDTQAYARVSTYDGTLNVYWDKAIRRRRGTAEVNPPESGAKLMGGQRHYRSSSPAKTTFVGSDDGTNVLIQYLDGSDILQSVSGGTAISTGKKLYFASWKD